MNDFFKKHQDIIILSILLVITLSLLLSNLRSRSSLNTVEKAVLSTLAPFQDAVGWTMAKAALVWDDYIYLVHVRRENKELREKANRLAFENALLVERMKFYQRLDRLLRFPGIDTAQFEVAGVIGRDTTDRVKLLIINKGTRHGIEKNMPVITHQGLVGRVARAAALASKVLLITDVRSAIDAVTQETRDGMVVVGTNSPFLDTRYLEAKAEVSDGDRVISSGLGGVFPKGLFIGVLKDVRPTRDGLFLSARVEPAVDLGRLEEVIVIKTRKPAEPSEGADR